MSISLDFLFFMSCCLIWHVLFHPSICTFFTRLQPETQGFSALNISISYRCCLSVFLSATVDMHQKMSTSASLSFVPVSLVTTLPQTLQCLATEQTQTQTTYTQTWLNTYIQGGPYKRVSQKKRGTLLLSISLPINAVSYTHLTLPTNREV